MPFTSTKDYYDPHPGLQIGLQLGQAMAQRKYQDQSMALAEKRQALFEQEDRRRVVQTNIEAEKIQLNMDAQENFRFQFSKALDQELGALPPEKRGDDVSIKAAQRVAYTKSIPFLPADQMAKALDRDDSQAAIAARYADQTRGKLDALNARLDSNEFIATLRDDAKGAVTEDQYVNRHLNAHAKQANLPMMQADADLRRIYRLNHGADKKDPSELMGEDTSIPDTVGQLERAKAAGVKKVEVKKDGSVSIVDKFWGGTDINKAIDKAKKEEAIRGGSTSTPQKSDGKSKRVFQYDPKTGGIKK